MKKLIISTMILLCLVSVVPALALDGVLSQPISYDSGINDTAIYGDYVVWSHNQNQIFLYDIVKATTPVIIGNGNILPTYPNIYGNIVIWTDATIDYNVVKYDVSTGNKVQLTTEASCVYGYPLNNYCYNSYIDQHRPWIQGTKIVWSRSTDNVIQVHDIFTGQTSTLPITGYDVVVYGDYLAYTRGGYYNYDVYLYNLKTGTEALIGTGDSRPNPPVLIDSKYVYYFSTSTGETLHTYEIATQQTSNYSICGAPNHPRAYEGKIYLDYSCTGWKTQQFDTKTAVFSVINTPTGTWQYTPAIYENKLVVDAGGSGSDYVAIFEITSPKEEVYSLNSSSNTVNVINPYKGTTISTITTGNGPSDAGLSPDWTKLYVLNSTDKTVSIVQTYDFAITTQALPINYGIYTPQAIAGDNEGNAYVALKKNGQNGVIKKLPAGNTITLTGQNPNSIKISPDGKTLFVSVADINSVTSIDVASFTPQTNIVTGGGTTLIKP